LRREIEQTTGIKFYQKVHTFQKVWTLPKFFFFSTFLDVASSTFSFLFSLFVFLLIVRWGEGKEREILKSLPTFSFISILSLHSKRPSFALLGAPTSLSALLGSLRTPFASPVGEVCGSLLLSVVVCGCLLFVGWLLIGCWLLAVGCWLVVGCLVFVDWCLVFVVVWCFSLTVLSSQVSASHFEFPGVQNTQFWLSWCSYTPFPGVPNTPFWLSWCWCALF